MRVIKSSTVRARGPSCPRTNSCPGMEVPEPRQLQRSTVGLSPAIPQKWAGTRIDPPISVPNPAGLPYAAMAAASPPEEPPGVRSGLCGFTVRPKNGLTLS